MIWEGVVLEDYVFVGPGAVFTNDRYPRSRHAPEASARYRNKGAWLEPTMVKRGASIGAGARIMCGVTIGEYAMIGAGSLVTRNVPAYRLVAGSPARSLGWACACGQRLGEWLACRACGSRYHLEGQVLVPESSRCPTRHAVA
jgi:UDP-2-acetamido-3-amino-2,3-dideoxy-glucuronate N-acetyltransferase